MLNQRYPKLRFPPLLVIGAFAVLTPIFILLTVQALNRQRDNVTNLMVEKGAALIRSFEAGARTGMMRMGGGGYRVQRLLTETAQLPDIVFLMVTDPQGVVLAHNELDKVGSRYGEDLDLGRILAAKKLSWRIVVTPEGGKVFEVYSIFQPVRNFRHFHPGMPGEQAMASQASQPPAEQIIFVGLEMDSVENARRQDARHTVVMGSILLLVCFGGLVIVYLLQAYGSTKSSLARLTQFSQRLTENMPIGLLALDVDNKVLALNRHGATLLALTEQDLVGRPAGECLPPALAGLAPKMAEQGGVTDTELDCILADGRHLPLEVISTFLADGGGQVSEKVFLFRDLSEIKELKKEVVRSQRLAAIGQLAAGVAHEIRNPLSSIKGFATYFKERYQEVAEDQQVAAIMIQEVERLNRVIGQLLEFARPLKIKAEPVSLPELLNHSLRMIEEDAGQKGITVRPHIGPMPAHVLVDGDRLKQILLNLYLNGIEAMESGGTLEVSMAVAERILAIKVSDNGHGIAPDKIGAIFDPYYTTKPAGTGLGLAIVHKIVEALDGEISVQSRLGRGTEFSLRIPLAEEAG
ncbi:MAG: ATP-binding protein [Desulfobulbaceae bacterium]|nr:ATP-binding protein [Desulfobulbaceae bacterium]